MPIRDLENKLFSFSSNTHSQQDFQLPTVFSTNCTGMDSLFSESSPDNFNDVRGRTPTSKSLSRDPSLSSTKSLITLLWNTLDTNNFYFILFFLILYRFCFVLFSFLDDGEAHDTEVT